MKFEELMSVINDEVSKVMKSPLTEPQKPKNEAKKVPYRTALQSDEEIDEILFVQDDIKRLVKDEKRKPKKL
jgi:hypothetical protein